MWSRARVARQRGYTGRTGKSRHGKLLAMQKGNAHRETQAQEQVPSMDAVGTGSSGVEVPAAPLKGAATLAAPAAPLRAAVALAAPLKSAAACWKTAAAAFAGQVQPSRQPGLCWQKHKPAGCRDEKHKRNISPARVQNWGGLDNICTRESRWFEI
jgi:hypothetical protein